MQQPWRTWLIVLAAVPLLAGCQLLSHHHEGACDSPPPLDCPEKALLLPDDVLRLTVGNSGMGAALEAGADGEQDSGCLCGHPGKKREELSRKLKAYAADEYRNEAAGLALQNYFRLAEARGQHAWALRALDTLNGLVEQVEELEKQGLPVPESLNDSRRSRSEVATRALRAKMTADQLHEQLKQAVGPCPCTILTLETFHVSDIPIDEKAAVALGLKMRPGLNLLRTALCGLDASTLPVIQQMLGGLNSLLGGPSLRCIPMAECLMQLMPCLMEEEVEKARRQLQAILADRERKVASEIRLAVRNICSQVGLVRLAREREELARKKLEEAQEKSARGLADSAAVAVARREYYQALSDSLHEAVEWEVARANLEQAQGLLVRRAVAAAAAHHAALMGAPCP